MRKRSFARIAALLLLSGAFLSGCSNSIVPNPNIPSANGDQSTAAPIETSWKAHEIPDANDLVVSLPSSWDVITPTTVVAEDSSLSDLGALRDKLSNRWRFMGANEDRDLLFFVYSYTTEQEAMSLDMSVDDFKLKFYSANDDLSGLDLYKSSSGTIWRIEASTYPAFSHLCDNGDVIIMTLTRRDKQPLTDTQKQLVQDVINRASFNIMKEK